MSRHESGTVRIIPAEYTHMFHQVNRYGLEVFADGQRPRRTNSDPTIYPVKTIHEPGRHRAAEPEYWSMTCNGPCCPPGFSCPGCA